MSVRSVDHLTTFGFPGPHTMSVTNDVVLADAQAGSFVINLPNVGDAYKRTYYVKRIDATANNVTLNAPASTIDGAASRLIGPYVCFKLVSDGARWHLI